MQLDETRGGIAAAGRSKDAGWGSDGALDGAERSSVRRREAVGRVLEVRVVEEVEGLRSDLELHGFSVGNSGMT